MGLVDRVRRAFRPRARGGDHPDDFCQMDTPQNNPEDWLQCKCGAWHYIANQKEKRFVWCPMCSRDFAIRGYGP